MRNNINVELARRKLTKAELAEKLNVSAPTLRKWINGGDIPSSKLLEMKEVLRCESVDYLLEETDLDPISV